MPLPFLKFPLLVVQKIIGQADFLAVVIIAHLSRRSMRLVIMTNKVTIRFDILLLNFYSVTLKIKQGCGESRVTIRVRSIDDDHYPSGVKMFADCFDIGMGVPFYVPFCVYTCNDGIYICTNASNKLEALMTIMDHFRRIFKIENETTLNLRSANSGDNHEMLLYATIQLGLQLKKLHWNGLFNNVKMFQDVVEISSNVLNVTIESENGHDFTSGIASFRVGAFEIDSAHWFTRENLFGLVNCFNVTLRRSQFTDWKFDSVDLNDFMIKFLADNYDLNFFEIIGIEDLYMSAVVKYLDVVHIQHLRNGCEILGTLRKSNGDLVTVRYNNYTFVLQCN